MIKEFAMVVGLIIALMIGAGVQYEYNVLDKPQVTELRMVEVEVEVPVEKIVTKEVEKEVIVEKLVEIKVKPKSITCTPVVEY